MIIFKVLLYIAILLFIVIGFLKVIWTKRLNYKESINHNSNKNNDIYFMILIPVFKEERIIKKTITYFKSVKTKNVKVYYITTNKELLGTKKENGTLEILSRYVNKKYIINYPYKTWDKASQLNYAIKYF